MARSRPRSRLAVALLVAALLPAGLPGSASAAPGEENLATGKQITASSTTGNFTAAKAIDDDPTTYWEAGADTFPNLLTVALGANADLNSIVLRVNPAMEWGPRTQTVEVLGREQSATEFTSLVAATPYGFDPATGNRVTIPLTAKVADVRLTITANTGAGGAQISDLQILGVAAPNPDLTVAATTTTPASPVTGDDITANATITNTGALASSAATNVSFYVDRRKVATTQVGALAAGASATVSAKIGKYPAGAHQVVAKVDEAGVIFETSESNNGLTSQFTVGRLAGPDLVAEQVTRTPDSPQAGDRVKFSVVVKNQGTQATAAHVRVIESTVTDAHTGALLTKFYGLQTGRIAAGGTAKPLDLGSWLVKANGKYVVRTVVLPDADEAKANRDNNTSTTDLYAGRGASLPYETVEAEDGKLGGGAAVVGPNRTIGDLAGEASGRKAVTLNTTGSSVEFTTKRATNSLVTRFSLPDAPTGGGTQSTVDVFVNGRFLKAIDLTSKYAWLYGPEWGPQNDPALGPARHIYDEANVLLGTTVPAGSKIKLQKSAANTSTYAIDFVSFEQVAPVANPDPARYTTPDGTSHAAVQAALDKVRKDITGKLVGVYLPAGDYENTGKLDVSGTAVQVVGAGPWFTRFRAVGPDNTDAGFTVDGSASGSTFRGFAYFGNYTTRIDGPGKVFDLENVSGLTFDNLWVEHTVVGIWGTNVQNTTVRDSRFRNTFADAVNFTNGSSNNHVVNNEARTTGDDSFALWAAADLNDGDQKNNLFEHLTALTPWRAAGIAVYGGQDNTFRDIYVADVLAGSGGTISSLSFGVTMKDFGPAPTTLKGISIVRSGGHFWGAQTFPALWLFSATNKFQAIRVSDLDIVDPTYSGIMFQTNYVNGQPANTITDTKFTNVSITGAKLSGDAFEAKSGFGLWANEFPEPGQGPAIGSVTFEGLRLKDNAVDVRNTTSTFTINR
ncbi:CARDB domain-containing protein [Lentzea sp. NPDC051213]|uniref:CARDB domain-containing protein n=1 Tax=Lentzea sp. NPDC051213 TaxID=3364126 RepID=UPI0037926FF5